MQVKVDIKGLDEYRDRIKQAPSKAIYAAEGAMKVFSIKVKEEVKKSLNVRDKIGKSYISSAPGDPPRKRTGHLFKSVYNRINKINKFVVQGIVGDNAEYAVHLEYGTSKMAPRPYMRPAVEKNKSLFETMFKKIFDNL